MDFFHNLYGLLSEQRRELAAADAIDSDFDFAYRLQLQEALAASLASQPSSSTAVTVEGVEIIDDDGDDVNASRLRNEEPARAEREIEDRVKEDDLRHDGAVAREISVIPETEWKRRGDGGDFEKPFGEGSSSSGNMREDGVVRVYFKGLVSEENAKGVLVGIGVVIRHLSDNIIFKVSKVLVGNGTSKAVAEMKALIEGFNAVIALEFRRVVFCSDYFPLLQYVKGRWPAKQQKVATLVHQVNQFQRTLAYCNLKLVPRHDIKFAFKLARDAIVSQIQSKTPAESSESRKILNETCAICLEDTDVNRIFSVDGCQHRYCFSCMKQYVEVKLLQGMVPKCPHVGCKNELVVDSCRTFLTQKLIETMQHRKLEASIPVTEKIYCPRPRCSALMSKTEVFEYSKNLIGQSEQSGPKKCLKCHGLFCFNCKVPWHIGMTCNTYKRLHPNPPAEDLKLKNLASRSLWHQCVKCNHMIELAEGCYHMTCRCGYEFCYNCGAEWKDKRATCKCPLWAEDNIWLEDNEESGEEEDEEDDDDYYSSDYSGD